MANAINQANPKSTTGFSCSFFLKIRNRINKRRTIPEIVL
jgi:hypothetical protein